MLRVRCVFGGAHTYTHTQISHWRKKLGWKRRARRAWTCLRAAAWHALRGADEAGDQAAGELISEMFLRIFGKNVEEFPRISWEASESFRRGRARSRVLKLRKAGGTIFFLSEPVVEMATYECFECGKSRNFHNYGSIVEGKLPNMLRMYCVFAKNWVFVKPRNTPKATQGTITTKIREKKDKNDHLGQKSTCSTKSRLCLENCFSKSVRLTRDVNFCTTISSINNLFPAVTWNIPLPTIKTPGNHGRKLATSIHTNVSWSSPFFYLQEFAALKVQICTYTNTLHTSCESHPFFSCPGICNRTKLKFICDCSLSTIPRLTKTTSCCESYHFLACVQESVAKELSECGFSPILVAAPMKTMDATGAENGDGGASGGASARDVDVPIYERLYKLREKAEVR